MLAAPESLRGKMAKCPGCGNLLSVPTATTAAPAPISTAEPDIFGIGSLAAHDPFAAGAGQLSQPANPLAPNPLQARGPSATADTDSSKLLLIGIGGGAAVLIVLILIVVIALSSGGGQEVAQTEDAPAGSGLATPAPVAATSPAPTSPAPTASAPSPIGPITSPSATAAATPAPRATSPFAVSSKSAAPVSGSPESTSTAPATSASASPAGRKHALAELPAGLVDWHGKSRDKLVGMFGYNPDENPAARLSWMTALLPHLGYQKQYDALARDKLVTDKANLQIAVQVIPEFQNPIEGRTRWEGYPFEGLALTHFAGMSGIEDARNVCAGQLPRTDPRAGVFGYEAVARPDAITDGTSQTIMVIGNGQLASPWIMGGGATIRGARAPYFDPDSGLGTRGLPAGGTLAVMADGSVRQIPANIDAKVFRAMCTIHGAESIDREPAPAFNLEEWK
jgi:hypothetical protein